jgi:oligoendopeptidase F
MAHELGHGIHDLYTKGNYPSVAHPGLTLAETASTLGENILFDRLLSRANKTERITMLSDKIGDAYASIIRQTFFIKFEQEVYSKIKDGLTYEQISDIYFKTLKEQFGTSLSIPEEFKYEWAYIPHLFRYPFYTYAYSFGDLLSMSLYAKYKTEGKSFIPKIEKILAAGGSQDPVKLLKSIGIDITNESFWQGGFDTIKERIVELKELTK